MSAADDAREQLEAVIHRELTAAFRRGRTGVTETITGPFASERILAAADAYAAVLIATAPDLGRARLDLAVAEIAGRA